MYVTSLSKVSENVPISSSDFSEGNGTNTLIVNSPDIWTATLMLGFRWRWPLQLITWIPDSTTPFLLCARDSASGFLDSLLRRPIFDVMPVHLTREEYELIYTVQYPGKDVDPQMIADAMERDAEYCKARGLFFD